MLLILKHDRKKSFFLMSKYIEMGANLIIRPPRAEYDYKKLPINQFVPNYGMVQREEVIFKNSKGQNIIGSYYHPNEKIPEISCVIYLHGNASSQREGTFLVPIFIPSGVSVFCFDFSGCGCSDGEYISLGYFERDDVSCGINYIRENFGVGRVALWGRSMGAACSIYALADDPTIAAAIVDSPFCSLPELVRELAKTQNIPGMVTSMAAKLVGKKIRDVAKFDIEKLVPLDVADQCFSPVFFIHGEHDDFILPIHSKKLFDKYSGEDKQIRIVPGSHNSFRPFDVQIAAVLFLARCLEAPIVIDDVVRTLEMDYNEAHFENVEAMFEAMQ